MDRTNGSPFHDFDMILMRFLPDPLTLFFVWETVKLCDFGTAKNPVKAASMVIGDDDATVFVDGTTNYLYLYVNSTSTESFGNFASYGYAPVVNASGIVFIDGYFIYAQKNSNQFFVSDLNSLAVDALSFASSEGSLDNIVGIMANHRDLMIFNAFFPPASKVEHDAWIESVHTKRTDLVIFVIEELASSHSIGICQLCNIDWQNRSAELQIRIGEERYQSKGFVTEATKLLCQFGFADLNLHRIYLNVVASNVRAIKAYEKCGFVREGLLREAAFIDDAWVDVVVLGKLEAAIK